MSTDVTIERHRTALGRGSLSRPLALALEDGLLTDATVFDYGCGRGDDLTRLRRLGYRAEGWDPVYRPHTDRAAADLVNLGYVVNVIEDPKERIATLRAAWDLADQVLVVSARMHWEAKSLRTKVGLGDGVVTGRRTFQRFYDQDELRTWLSTTLQVEPIAAAPGVFYAFKHPQAASAFLARRVRRHTPRPRLPAGQAAFDRHRELLEPLIAFISDRGRLPTTPELHDANNLINQLGSIKRAFAVIRRATGEERWDQLRHDRTQDLLVYLALTAFGGRPQFTSLDDALQLDIRTFFGSYRKACAEADQLLFSAGDPAGVDTACRTAEVGKLTPDALYIHTTGLDTLSPILRVLEGCARTLVGTVERANIIKLGRLEPKVSYLAYPDFDSDPHPALTASVTAGLRSLRVDFRSYQDTSNPPILHRKELLVPVTYPHRDRFVRLTAQEERRCLYEHPQVIGTRNGWQAVLDAAQVCHRGHRLQRRPTAS